MIAIVTDSTAYLTHEEAVELGVVIVPMSYSFGKDMSLNEGCIENDEHAERQVAEGIDHVHTPQATLAGSFNAFQRLRRAGYEVKNSDFFRIGIPFTFSAVIAGYIYTWLVWGM